MSDRHPSLGPKRTNQHSDPSAQAQTDELINATDVAFRHRGWAPQRAKIEDALIQIQQYSNRVQRFRRCGSNAWVVQDPADPENVALCADYCTDRFCVPCMRARSRQLGLNLLNHYKGKTLRFMTLTLKHTDQTLAEMLDRLYKSFARLRRSKLWKERVTGGIAFTEVKIGTGSKQWHPHLHILVTGKYVAQKALSKVWLAITKDSHSVDIRFVQDPGKAASYITKYATKGWTTEVVNDPPKLIEAIKTLHGRRLYIKFGDLVGVDLSEKPTPVDWDYVGSLQALMRKAKGGDQTALEILAKLWQKGQQCAEIVNPTDQQPTSALGP